MHPFVAVVVVQTLGAAVVSAGPVALGPCLVVAAADSVAPGMAGEHRTWGPLGSGPPAVSLVAAAVQPATVVAEALGVRLYWHTHRPLAAEAGL